MFDELIGIHEIVELKPGWFVRIPRGRRDMLWNCRFEPTTLLYLAIAGAVTGGTLQAVSMRQQGRAAREAGKAQQAIAERNALLAERQAEAEKQAAVAEAKRQEEEGEELLARQIGLFAKGRVEMRGTPLAVVVDTAEKLEADRLTILREGAIRDAQRRGQADILKMQGKAARRRGRAAYRGSVLAATGTIMSTVGQASYARYRMSQ